MLTMIKVPMYRTHIHKNSYRINLWIIAVWSTVNILMKFYEIQPGSKQKLLIMFTISIQLLKKFRDIFGNQHNEAKSYISSPF
ncbi:unnamed protein product [Acanthoscelides obtectus]|uniref:Uncharacterized protein n=1 Tax=Acanthoscelides obtectus TaxID=200917 RepID=A0A9P0M2E9_ACAOB|nr:unnamed protein product [Acanthoscelides obtectus]CAK1644571.1 hypothetical protein AOBTE_LOCUS13875 [Acanthoscelides obtectus]